MVNVMYREKWYLLIFFWIVDALGDNSPGSFQLSTGGSDPETGLFLTFHAFFPSSSLLFRQPWDMTNSPNPSSVPK